MRKTEELNRSWDPYLEIKDSESLECLKNFLSDREEVVATASSADLRLFT
jgi:hypothetical protein